MSQSGSDCVSQGTAADDCESVGECDDPFPSHAVDAAYDEYLEHLTFRHMDLIRHQGCSHLEYFPDDSLDDCYSNNLYAISWFYHGCYDFDTWEADYDAYLYREAFEDRISGTGV